MRHYIIGRIVRAVLVLFLVSIAVGSMFDLVPGDPAAAILGEAATPEAVDAVHERLGLDRPYLERYGDWVGDAIRGDLGESYSSRQDVMSLLLRALPVTAQLVLLAMTLGLVVSLPLGVLAAKHEGRRLDRAVTAGTSFMQAMPSFIAVPVIVYLVVLKAGVLSATGWVPITESPAGNISHLILPCFVMSLSVIPVFTAALRSDMIEVLREDFISNARAKGLSERAILVRHALRPSSFSLLTLVGLALGQLVSSAVIVEVLFVLPGLGELSFSAIMRRDIPVVQGIVIFVAVLFVIVNMLVDVGYRLLDPRVRLQAA